MFDRIHYESWQIIFPIGGFLLLLAIFTLMVIRVSRLPKGKVKHLAHLPFDEEEKETRDEPIGPEQR
ncbi:MAG TPA: hypothetical protein PLU30_17835 [Verrucomicrobiae bacterium]|nr:hypothetical protein [Verrucomicrobiae bacterium]